MTQGSLLDSDDPRNRDLPREPDEMARWVQFGAEVMNAMLRARKGPLITLATFAQHAEKRAHELNLHAGEATVRWVWQALLAHPYLSQRLRSHHSATIHKQRRSLELLPAGALVLIELSPGPGRLRKIGWKTSMPNEWALVELTEPQVLQIGNVGRMKFTESTCWVTFRRRPKPPGRDSSPKEKAEWEKALGPPEVQECDSLNHAAQTASEAVEHFRRTHNHNVFQRAYWLRDRDDMVLLDDLRDRVEYDGDDPSVSRAKVSASGVKTPPIDELLRALTEAQKRPKESPSTSVALPRSGDNGPPGRPGAEKRSPLSEGARESTRAAEGVPSRAIRKGTRLRYANGVEAEVLRRNRDGTLRVRVPVLDTDSYEDGDMPVWRFAQMRREDGSWAAIDLSEAEQQQRAMIEQLMPGQ